MHTATVRPLPAPHPPPHAVCGQETRVRIFCGEGTNLTFFPLTSQGDTTEPCPSFRSPAPSLWPPRAWRQQGQHREAQGVCWAFGGAESAQNGFCLKGGTHKVLEPRARLLLTEAVPPASFSLPFFLPSGSCLPGGVCVCMGAAFHSRVCGGSCARGQPSPGRGAEMGLGPERWFGGGTGIAPSTRPWNAAGPELSLQGRGGQKGVVPCPCPGPMDNTAVVLPGRPQPGPGTPVVPKRQRRGTGLAGCSFSFQRSVTFLSNWCLERTARWPACWPGIRPTRVCMRPR